MMKVPRIHEELGWIACAPITKAAYGLHWRLAIWMRNLLNREGVRQESCIHTTIPTDIIQFRSSSVRRFDT